MSVPADLLYSAEHEWVAGDTEPGSEVTVGITAHAADALGDVETAGWAREQGRLLSDSVAASLRSTARSTILKRTQKKTYQN